jgi:hypothetical protein
MPHRGFTAPFILIGILILTTVFGGIYLYSRPSTTLPSPKVTILATPLNSPQSAWQEYDSSLMGDYTIKVPANWNINDHPGVFINSWGEVVFTPPNQPIDSPLSTKISIVFFYRSNEVKRYSYSTTADFQKWTNQQPSTTETSRLFKSGDNLTIDGRNAVTLVSRSLPGDPSGAFYSRVTWIHNENSNFYIELGGNEKDVKLLIPLYNQILSTFKFTTPLKSTDISGWKTYMISTVGLAFQLPPKIYQKGTYVDEILKPPEEFANAQTGTEICSRFKLKTISLVEQVYAGGFGCFPESDDLLTIGGSSLDFQAPRSGGFVELQGFVKNGDKYFAKQNLNRTALLPTDLVTEVLNTHDVDIIRILGRTSTELDNHYGLFSDLGDGTIGALINTKNTNYPGLAIMAKLNDIDPKTFDQILSTFKFTD